MLVNPKALVLKMDESIWNGSPKFDRVGQKNLVLYTLYHAEVRGRHFEIKLKIVMFKASTTSVTTVKCGPIDIDTNKLKGIIRDAHVRSKTADDEKAREKNIINLSKDFISTLGQNGVVNESNYQMEIDVQEKKPREDEKKLDNLWDKITKRKPINYKIIDATIDPNLLSKNFLNSNLDQNRKILSLRVKCLAIISDNDFWRNTIFSWICIRPPGSGSTDLQEVIIEWEEEIEGGGRKRYRTHLAKNPKASLLKDFTSFRILNFNSISDWFKIELLPTNCPKCGFQEIKRHIKQKMCGNGDICECDRNNTSPANQHKGNRKAGRKNTPKQQDMKKAQTKKNIRDNNKDDTLNAELLEVKDKVIKIIASIAANDPNTTNCKCKHSKIPKKKPDLSEIVGDDSDSVFDCRRYRLKNPPPEAPIQNLVKEPCLSEIVGDDPRQCL
ncbi:hypothetical protein WDU94_004223 [Cyamophila willieti]